MPLYSSFKSSRGLVDEWGPPQGSLAGGSTLFQPTASSAAKQRSRFFVRSHLMPPPATDADLESPTAGGFDSGLGGSGRRGAVRRSPGRFMTLEQIRAASEARHQASGRAYAMEETSLALPPRCVQRALDFSLLNIFRTPLSPGSPCALSFSFIIGSSDRWVVGMLVPWVVCLVRCETASDVSSWGDPIV